MSGVLKGRTPRVVAGVVLLAVALAPLALGDSVRLAQFTEILLDIIAIAGLNIAAGYGGLMVLGIGALCGIGAYATAVLNIHAGLPIAAAIVPGALLGAALGMVLLAPSLRLGRAAFAVVSLYTAYNFISATKVAAVTPLTGGADGIRGVGALVPLSAVGYDSVLQSQIGYAVVLGATLLILGFCRRLIRSHWGGALLTVRDDDVAAAAFGISPRRARLLALLVCAVCASLSGALSAGIAQGCVDTCTVSPGTYSLTLSIFLFSAMVVGGAGRLPGPVVGGVVLGVFQVMLTGGLSGSGLVQTLLAAGAVYGVLLLFSAVLAHGLWGLLTVPFRRGAAGGTAAADALTFPPLRERADIALAVDDVVVRFGRTAAVDHVSLSVHPGEVHALIGANGSGKTTVLNAVSGVVIADEGAVRIGGRDVTAMAPQRRARRGLARTFQTPRVAEDLSVESNLLLGGFVRYRSGLRGLFLTPWTHRREGRAVRREARELLASVGLLDRASSRAGLLTHGQRRLLDVARAMLAEPHVVLLDEPAAGLAAAELNDLAAVIRAARDAGCAVVLVEHNLAFVRRVADVATALDRGRVLAAGPVHDVLARPEVIACFVGEVVA